MGHCPIDMTFVNWYTILERQMPTGGVSFVGRLAGPGHCPESMYHLNILGPM